MADLLAIVYFFVVAYGLGGSLLRFFKEHQEPLERHLMRVGFGLALWPLLGVLLHLLGVPLYWWLFFVLALPLPAWDLSRWYQDHRDKKKAHEGHHHKRRLTLRKDTLFALGALAIAIIAASVYLTGAFSYSYLEDGDPWHHGVSTAYVAKQKVLYTDYPKSFRYLDAYPPGYAIINAMTYQLAGDMVWTLKVDNVLFIAIGLFLFFALSRQLLDDPRIALVATIILAMIPSYFSHFIWAHTLAVTLFFPTLYASLRMKEHARWLVGGAVGVAGMLLVQPTEPIKALVMLGILGIVHCVKDRSMIKKYLSLLVLGVALSSLWWGAMILRYDGGMNMMREGLGQRPSTNQRWSDSSHFGPLGSATRLYTWGDFFSPKAQNLMTAPVGIGWAPMLLMLLGLLAVIAERKSEAPSWPWLVVAGWLVFTFAGLYGGTKLPLALFTFRFWLIVPIPIALLAAKGIFAGAKRAQTIGVPKLVTICFLVLLVALTAGKVKAELNTSQWAPEPAMLKYQQLDGYENLRSLPKGTRVYDLCHREKFGDTVLLSYDLDACPWCDAERAFRRSAYNASGWNVTPAQIESFAKREDYPYIFVEGNCIDTLGKRLREDYDISDQSIAQQSTVSLFQEMAESGLFQLAHQTQGSILFKS